MTTPAHQGDADALPLPTVPGATGDAIEATAVDPNAPWQAQYAERLSRGITQGSPGARRAARNFVLCLVALALLLVAVLAVVAVRG